MSRDGNSEKPGIRQRVREGLRNAAASALRGIADKLEVPKATFEIAETKIDFSVDVDSDTIWATQIQMAELFGVSTNTVGEHLQNAYREGELQEAAVARKFRVTAKDGKDYNTLHYNLEAIFAVGSRVKSPRAGQFRQWAFRILKEYVVHGYALNEQRLRDDPAAAQSLAEKVREIRFDEKNLYARVRDCVVMVASDYDGSSEQIRSFFARMQDKFHYAACEKTAQEIVLTRADGMKERMGMTTQLNNRPTLADAKIAKNYLSTEELKLQMLAGEAFFVFVENAIARNRTLTTAQLLAKIDDVFKFNEMPEFPGYGGRYLKPQADAHVKAQYDLFKSRTQQERYDATRRPPQA